MKHHTYNIELMKIGQTPKSMCFGYDYSGLRIQSDFEPTSFVDLEGYSVSFS